MVDGERSGRPREIGPEVAEALLTSVRENRADREKSSEVLAYEQGISCRSALRILKKYGLHSVKPTTKPGLTEAMKRARLEWCLAYEYWTLKDWKNISHTHKWCLID